MAAAEPDHRKENGPQWAKLCQTELWLGSCFLAVCRHFDGVADGDGLAHSEQIGGTTISVGAREVGIQA